MKAAIAAAALALAFAVWPAGPQAEAAMSRALHSPAQTGNLLTEAGHRHYRHRNGAHFSFSFGTPYYHSYPRYYYPRYYYPRTYYYVPRQRYYSPRPRRGGSCSYWAQRCAENWGSGGANWRGCMRYHGCN